MLEEPRDTVMGSNTPGLQIPELLDHIIGFLCDDRQALRTCALASRMLTSAAQRQLFSWITFASPSHNNYISPRRLRTILADSPHLTQFIRRIELHLNHESNAELASVGLTHVADIMVYGLARSRPDIHQPTVAAACRLIGLESVHRVQVMGRFRDMSVIGRLFGECTPHLQEVVFEACWLEQSLEANATLTWPNTVRTQLARLKLLGSDRAMAWLVDEDCPLGISELTEVNVSGSMAAKGYVYTLLHRTRRTVTHLAFSLWDLHRGPHPDLTQFSFLTRLTVQTRLDALPRFPPALADVDPHNRVREIVFTSERFDNRSWASDPEDDWTQELKAPLRAFDDAFAALPLPELQRVEIQIRQKTGDPPGEWFKDLLPRLVARRLLLVTVYPDTSFT
ncbi:hypothetical protein DFH08DRAFT_875890 [Mycena albidolilacea]|uniref:Uncharacterized protein n=1 Tax=Mycena albidolilacea TaxID=1033008 RepID=A0AAD6ZUG2_9AGAR|nr:hypothetical protein DFH08DRAFT_875890 [Mycena albidolilacea]